MGYFEESFATVEYDNDADIVVATMLDFAEGERFRSYMDAIIDALADNDCDKLIADTSKMGALAQEDQQWSVVDWAPRAEETGLDHLAFVMPESVISKMSVENVVEMTEDTMNRDFFEEKDAAREWLSAQN